MGCYSIANVYSMSRITKKDIKLMSKTRRIKLNKEELFWHYSVVLFILMVPIFVTLHIIQYYFFDNYDGVRSPSELAIGYWFILLAILIYYIQKSRLKMKCYNIKTTEEMFKRVIEKTAAELNWSIEQQDKNFVRAHRNWDWSSSWGELITIIREEDKILINSICDPNAIFISVISYGHNKKNVKTFIENLKKEIRTHAQIQDSYDTTKNIDH